LLAEFCVREGEFDFWFKLFMHSISSFGSV
jgi:hypothetical protein